MDYIYLKPSGEISHFLNTLMPTDDVLIVPNSLIGDYEDLINNFIYDFQEHAFQKVDTRPSFDYEWSLLEGNWVLRDIKKLPRFVMRHNYEQ
jgi:hypothetical protein